MKTFVQPGDTITVAAPYDVASGGGCLVGVLFGVASFTAAAGADVALVTTGVFDLPKVSAQAWTLGAAIYWDAAAKLTTTTEAGNTPIGTAVAVAANPSAAGRVRLVG